MTSGFSRILKIVKKGILRQNCAVLGYYAASSPVTGLWPRGFQKVRVPRFHDNGTGWW